VKGLSLGVSAFFVVEPRQVVEAPWANCRQRALNFPVAEINAKTDLNIALESLERARHGPGLNVVFAIKGSRVSKR
jgi:hypothetical protein